VRLDRAARSRILQEIRLSGTKDKAIPLQTLTDPEVSRRLRLPDFKKQLAHEGDKVVSPKHRPALPPGNIPGPHSC
jgi:hypothetical protein